jgi:hypothetical protein
MRWKLFGCAVFLVLVAAGWAHLRPVAGERFQGLTAAQWASEIGQWRLVMWGRSNKTGIMSFWRRKRSQIATLLQELGIQTTEERFEMPLLKGDPAALPVLIELLESTDSQVRLMAAEGLEQLREKARPAIPALLHAIDDEDETVREQAEQTLYRVDREAAGKVGLEWTIMGLIRRDSKPKQP